ncbi:tetratricopeptide repeat protein [Phocaeicola sp.]
MKKLVLTLMSLCLAATIWGQTSADSEWTPQVEQAATLIKTDPAKAAEVFDDLLKGKNKKNTALLVEIGHAYLEQGKKEEAAEYAQRAKDVNGKYADAYLLSGDVALALNDVNKASSDYNQAIYLDENCSEAYFKYAQVYKGVDPQLSLDMLMRLQSKTPADNRINKELGDVYYTMGQYGKAKEAYETYLKAGEPTEQDYTRYAMLLYLNKDYAQSLDVAQKGLALAPENHVLKRLAMYDDLELKEYDAGLEAAATFFSNAGNPDCVYLDYVYFARLLEADKQYDEAIAQFHKALAMDQSHTEIYKDLSDVYEKKRDFPKAIEAYRNYLGGLKGEPDISDLFLYGRLNYYAATDTTYLDKQPMYLAEADTIFAQVAQKVPDNYLGNFWRARTNSLRDPETTQGLAKPYYEAALGILEQKPDASKSVLVECNSYLGYYYFVKADYNQSKLYWNRILEIDPGNETATKALGGIK